MGGRYPSIGAGVVGIETVGDRGVASCIRLVDV